MWRTVQSTMGAGVDSNSQLSSPCGMPLAAFLIELAGEDADQVLSSGLCGSVRYTEVERGAGGGVGELR
jgi:hypothetical protein